MKRCGVTGLCQLHSHLSADAHVYPLQSAAVPTTPAAPQVRAALRDHLIPWSRAQRQMSELWVLGFQIHGPQ